MASRGPQRKSVERELAMVDAYRRGRTLADIGADYGLTRERVRQLLSRHGITAKHGGKTVRLLLSVRDKQESRRQREAQREARCLATWGMSREQYAAHVAEYGCTTTLGSPMNRYRSQANNARRRRIEWRMTFPEWWGIWLQSGRWEQRGRGQGYCMARYGDAGPYVPDNVYICTVGQNFSDSYLVDHPRRKRSRGFSVDRYKVRDGHRFQVRFTRPLNDAGKRHFAGFSSKETAEQWAVQALAA